MKLAADAPVVRAIQTGDVDALRAALATAPALATARLVTARGEERTLLHVATDWPGHVPRVAETIAILVGAGAEVDAPFVGRHAETALHWAASSDDVDALEALLAAGATLDARGGVIAGGTPLDDAVAFGQWTAAARLLARGARTRLATEAALGLVDRVQARLANPPEPLACDLTNAFWYACHGGQLATAMLLADAGAEVEWIGYDELAPVDAAERAVAAGRPGAAALVAWLQQRGIRTARVIRG